MPATFGLPNPGAWLGFAVRAIGRGAEMSGAGRGVTPGAEPEAGSGASAPSQGQPASADGGTTAAGSAGTGQGKGPAAPGKAGSEASASATGASPDDEAASASSEQAGPRPSGRQAAGRARKKRSFWREFPILVVVALLLAVVIKTYAIQAFFIPSGSMENTLEINDRVLVNKLVYDVRGIHRGDIVVFNGDGSWDPGPAPGNTNFAQKFIDGFTSMFGFGHPGDILIKRVIGLPGDRVACCDAQDRVTVNGVPLTEQSYLFPGDAPSENRFNIVVPPGRLMGDGRPPAHFRRLPGSPRRSRRRYHPGKRGDRPGLRHHLAAEPVADPAHSRHLRAAQAERRGSGFRDSGRPGSGPGDRRPAVSPA